MGDSINRQLQEPIGGCRGKIMHKIFQPKGFSARFYCSVSIAIYVFSPLLLVGCTLNHNTPQIVTLQNQYLKVKAKSTGAELVSIQSLEDEVEYLWQGDSITWSDHAIVQFPIVGNLKNGSYEFKEANYEMMSHGFARITQFEILERSQDKVVFQLKSNASTMVYYPFEFTFLVTYQLAGKSVIVSFNVHNNDKQEMYFSLGYHPGFNWPLTENERMNDYFLQFSNKESSDRLLMKDNVIDSVQEDYLASTSMIPLTKDSFKNDAIILRSISSTSVSLKNKQNNKSVTLAFGKVPYLGIWSPKQLGNFVCIEPWFGIPDTKNASGNFEEKEGMMQLNQNASFNWDCTIYIN
jgi:galactose mutarotase-like enzyme